MSDGINTLVTSIREAVAARKQQDDELCASLQAHATAHAERSAAIVNMIAALEKTCEQSVSSVGVNIDGFETSTTSKYTDAHNALVEGLGYSSRPSSSRQTMLHLLLRSATSLDKSPRSFRGFCGGRSDERDKSQGQYNWGDIACRSKSIHGSSREGRE